MKTSELLDWLKARRIDAIETEYTITTHTGFTVYKNEVGTITFHGDGDWSTMVVSKLVEYMETPVEDRGNEKKYVVRCRVTHQCLQTDKFGYHVWTSENNAHEYTLKELKDLGIDVEHYDLEEVR